MNNRFKFRIPEFTDKEHFNGFQYVEIGDTIECTLCGSIGQPQQCTGIKDKNDKLVYEGDIINDGFENFTVVWDYDKFMVSTNERDYYTFEQLLSFEIVGNIFIR